MNLLLITYYLLLLQEGVQIISMKEKLLRIGAAAGGTVASFFTGIPPLMWALVAAMSLDVLTGLVVGAIGASEKTENGGLSSGTMLRGLLKKALIIIVVLLAALLDWAVAMEAGIEFTAVTGATCLWFIASEGISVLENIVRAGVPVPAILTKGLEMMKRKGEEEM